MRAILSGPDIAHFAALSQAGFVLVDDLPATLLVNYGGDAERAIARAAEFADAVPLGQEALVVNIVPPHGKGDWAGERAMALVWAHTRYAALAWAPLRIRVNAIGLGVSPVPGDTAAPAMAATPAEVAGTVLAMWRLASMTGQFVRLGAA